MFSASLGNFIRNIFFIILFLSMMRVAVGVILHRIRDGALDFDFSDENPVLLALFFGIPALVFVGYFRWFYARQRRKPKRPSLVPQDNEAIRKAMPQIVRVANMPTAPRTSYTLSPALGELLEEGWAASDAQRNADMPKTNETSGAFVTPEQHRARQKNNVI